jgi:MFS family permease
VAFLATHLPGVMAACGLPTQWAGWSLAMMGLFNIVGSVAMGWAVGRWRMKSLLSLVYATRAVAVLLFLLAPKTGPVMLVFAAVMGLTFLSTVPPTAGLVAKFFGPANMATLFGIVMLTHQVGGFLGAWLGGKVFEATGAYDWVWYIDIVLAVGAALIHLPIRVNAGPQGNQVAHHRLQRRCAPPAAPYIGMASRAGLPRRKRLPHEPAKPGTMTAKRRCRPCGQQVLVQVQRPARLVDHGDVVGGQVVGLCGGRAHGGVVKHAVTVFEQALLQDVGAVGRARADDQLAVRRCAASPGWARRTG